MKGHLYRVTLERIEDNKGNAVQEDAIRFTTRNHDDINEVIKKIRSGGKLPMDEAEAFAVGLKLFGEVILQNKDLELFRDFAPHFREFMQQLKGGRAS